MSDKLDFKPKTIIRDEEGHYIILKGSVQQEDLTILNIYAPNMGAANYINQLITKSKKHIDNNTIIVRDFNIPLTEMDRASKQKINKEIKVSNDTLDQMDITDIFNRERLQVDREAGREREREKQTPRQAESPMRGSIPGP